VGITKHLDTEASKVTQKFVWRSKGVRIRSTERLIRSHLDNGSMRYRPSYG
jgi:hypothetical protein